MPKILTQSQIDQYWRELVDSRATVTDIEKSGVSLGQLREGMATVATLRSNGIDVDTAIRNAQIVAAINRAMTKLGVSDVLLLEQGRLSGGTTWHAAGLVGPLRASESGTRLVQYSTQLYADLEAETEARVHEGAVAAQVEIPLERFLRQVVFLESLQQKIESEVAASAR